MKPTGGDGYPFRKIPQCGGRGGQGKRGFSRVFESPRKKKMGEKDHSKRDVGQRRDDRLTGSA